MSPSHYVQKIDGNYYSTAAAAANSLPRLKPLSTNGAAKSTLHYTFKSCLGFMLGVGLCNLSKPIFIIANEQYQFHKFNIDPTQQLLLT